MSFSIDYRNFSSSGEIPDKKNWKWWTITGDSASSDIADSIYSVISHLKQSQNKLEAQRQASARLYGNIPLYGSLGMTSSKTATIPTIKDRLTYNVCQSCVDTVTSKIAKNRPKPLFLTDGGNYKMQRKAQKLTKFVDGVFFANKVHEMLSPIAFRDCAVLGDGILHVYAWHNQIKIERVLASEIIVDEVEAIYGDPRQLYRVKNVDRDVLVKLAPEFKGEIMAASEFTLEDASVNHVADQVTVAEAWHLPSSPTAKDGRHVIVIKGHTLVDEPWTEDYFPFAILPWCKRLYGFWSQGGIEQIQNIQLEINKLLWVIQRSMHLMGSFKILVQNGSKIVSEHLNNSLGTIINYAGTPPQYITPPIIQPELYAHLATLKQAAYEQFGISQLSASSKKPEGLDSGKALREYNDIESERFMINGQNYESFHLALAKLIVRTGRKIYNETGKLRAKAPGSKFLETIDWSDIDMQDDQYIMQVFPVSSLPSDPAGRLATIQEYAQAGYLDPRTARKLADFPDLDQVETLANAAEERILQALDKIIDDGVYTSPDIYMDLSLAKQITLQYYNQYITQGLEQNKVEMLENFLKEATDLLVPEMPSVPQDPNALVPENVPTEAMPPQPNGAIL